MRRGCISLGNVQCDDCHRPIPYLDHYLVIDEQDGIEAETGEMLRYCVDCCLKKDYASYRMEKGERIFTFFTSMGDIGEKEVSS